MNNIDVVAKKIRIDNDLNTIAFIYDLTEFQKSSERIINDIKDLIEKRYKDDFVEYDIHKDFIARSPNGNRYVKCIVCGNIHKSNDFIIYGGHKKNYGICKTCWEKYERGDLDDDTKVCDDIRNYISFNNDSKQYRL